VYGCVVAQRRAKEAIMKREKFFFFFHARSLGVCVCVLLSLSSGGATV
jgi:hypothetical protein